MARAGTENTSISPSAESLIDENNYRHGDDTEYYRHHIDDTGIIGIFVVDLRHLGYGGSRRGGTGQQNNQQDFLGLGVPVQHSTKTTHKNNHKRVDYQPGRGHYIGTNIIKNFHQIHAGNDDTGNDHADRSYHTASSAHRIPQYRRQRYFIYKQYYS